MVWQTQFLSFDGISKFYEDINVYTCRKKMTDLSP